MSSRSDFYQTILSDLSPALCECEEAGFRITSVCIPANWLLFPFSKLEKCTAFTLPLPGFTKAGGQK